MASFAFGSWETPAPNARRDTERRDEIERKKEREMARGRETGRKSGTIYRQHSMVATSVAETSRSEPRMTCLLGYD